MMQCDFDARTFAQMPPITRRGVIHPAHLNGLSPLQFEQRGHG